MTTLLTTRDIGAIVGAKGLAACLGTLVSYLEEDFARWPDFDKSALEGAIAEYSRRERRFGGLIAKTGS